MKAKAYIKKEQLQIIRMANTKKNCDHKFKDYAMGYCCLICGYYSGYNEELNQLIKAEL